MSRASFFIVIGFPTLLFFTPIAANAASSGSGAAHGTGSTVINTGAMLTTKMAALHAALQDRLPESRIDILLPAPKITGWQSDIVKMKQKASALRTSCYGAIREANRDSILQAATLCERGDLMQEVSFLRKQSSYVTSLPLLSATVASDANASIGALIDANMTVVGAIDAGLYMQVDQLVDAKKKLTTQYRIPYWIALTKVRADRQLIWAGLMVRRLEEVIAESGNGSATQSAMLNAAADLASGAAALQSTLTTTDLKTAADNYAFGVMTLRLSRTDLLTATRLKQKDEQSQSSSVSSQ